MARRITAPLTAKVILNGGQRRDRTAAAALSGLASFQERINIAYSSNFSIL